MLARICKVMQLSLRGEINLFLSLQISRDHVQTIYNQTIDLLRKLVANDSDCVLI
jgi:hypothetical protein